MFSWFAAPPVSTHKPVADNVSPSDNNRGSAPLMFCECVALSASSSGGGFGFRDQNVKVGGIGVTVQVTTRRHISIDTLETRDRCRSCFKVHIVPQRDHSAVCPPPTRDTVVRCGSCCCGVGAPLVQAMYSLQQHACVYARDSADNSHARNARIRLTQMMVAFLRCLLTTVRGNLQQQRRCGNQYFTCMQPPSC